ncbi:MAG: hypothetical protein EBS38_02285 [Actinobacteria bacterium]|nr:hypothetical protein [Actinomycetota bacterium]
MKTVEQLKTYDSMAGKVLRGALHGCRSIRTGHHNRLRIVFSARTSEILQLIVVGPRERGMVYIQAIQVLKELEM